MPGTTLLSPYIHVNTLGSGSITRIWVTMRCPGVVQGHPSVERAKAAGENRERNSSKDTPVPPSSRELHAWSSRIKYLWCQPSIVWRWWRHLATGVRVHIRPNVSPQDLREELYRAVCVSHGNLLPPLLTSTVEFSAALQSWSEVWRGRGVINLGLWTSLFLDRSRCLAPLSRPERQEDFRASCWAAPALRKRHQFLSRGWIFIGMNLCKLIWGRKIRSGEVIRLLKRKSKDRRQQWREESHLKCKERFSSCRVAVTPWTMRRA